MAGLLDWYQDPATQQMLGLSAGLLSAGGPSPYPRSIGQGLGEGLLTGSRLASQARQGQLQGLQGEALRTSLESQKRTQAAIDALAEQIPPEDRARFLADPAGYLKAQNDPYTLGPGQKRMQGTREIASSAPNLTFQDVGGQVVGLNPQTGAPSTMLPKSMTPGEMATQQWNRYAFDNESEHQKNTTRIGLGNLGVARGNLGVAQGNLGLRGAETYYSTGMNPLGLPNFPALPQVGGVPVAPKVAQGIAAAGPEAAARVAGEASGKREVNMAGINETIDTAKDILLGRAGPVKDGQRTASPVPTGSVYGTAADITGSVFGVSTGGAEQAERLRVLAANLTMKMPRMEGPQSDKDTQAYREAAGQVGDSKIPIERRLAALEEVKKLYAKYDKQTDKVRVVDW